MFKGYKISIWRVPFYVHRSTGSRTGMNKVRRSGTLFVRRNGHPRELWERGYVASAHVTASFRSSGL